MTLLGQKSIGESAKNNRLYKYDSYSVVPRTLHFSNICFGLRVKRRIIFFIKGRGKETIRNKRIHLFLKTSQLKPIHFISTR